MGPGGRVGNLVARHGRETLALALEHLELSRVGEDEPGATYPQDSSVLGMASGALPVTLPVAASSAKS